MAVSFFNTATMYPRYPKWKVGNLMILVDTDQGLVMIDTGLGVHDHEVPTRLVRMFRLIFGIPYAPEETAIHQLENLGIPPTNVKHIIMTHLHFDHAGGLPDFPWAKVHLHQKEFAAMLKPKTWMERFAYDKADFAHESNWLTYDQCTEKWFEFDAIPLPFQPRMYLIPLFGHTSGHCGVAIEDGDGWIFQAGDAIPANADFKVTPMWLNRLVLGKHTPRIQKFAQEHPNVRVLAGHTFQAIDKKA
ncbi:MAG TPA: MBL fold metallo-hydrolase [Anaerolineaceae bacterium]|nr:MBL fold metallo-hydrolase [Anaerolineaceae bacterium]